MASLAGIGEGILLTPIATRVIRMPHWLALPRAQTIACTIAVSGAALHFALGNADWSGEGVMEDVLWLGIGVVLAAPLGQRWNRRYGEGRLTRLLALGLLAVVLQTIVSEI